MQAGRHGPQIGSLEASSSPSTRRPFAELASKETPEGAVVDFVERTNFLLPEKNTFCTER